MRDEQSGAPAPGRGEAESDPSAATPDAVTDAHCLVCHAVRPAHADRIIARALTVEASKLYARMVTS